MNKITLKVKVAIVLCLLAVGTSSSASNSAIEAQNLCDDSGAVVVYMNGVFSTPEGVDLSIRTLSSLYEKNYSTDEIISYEVLYNYTNGFEDLAEVFEQRATEQVAVLDGRFELFFEALRGDGSGWLAYISEVESAVGGVIEGFVEYAEAEIVRTLTAFMGDTIATQINYVEHSSRIDNWVLEGKKLLFVAHSQGNLFANAAYRYARGKVGPDSIKVVHVAPPAAQLNGPHVLADKDRVIQALSLLGSVASVTDTIPGYLSRPAGANGKWDILGHGFVEIYINPTLPTANSVLNHIDEALQTLEAPEAQAASGFFTATLTWNGSGDVDLHVYEPSGSHVYYAAKTGVSGYLDVDNTSANGPEHYFASCDADKLMPGPYVVSVANYSRAEGRRATVQLASWKEGVLGTRSVNLGGATGSSPAYDMFVLNVSKDEETGQYSIALVN